MLLRKIKTRGFLGHLGGVGASENGKPAFVELDFTDADLSLVHGANGAGKSTVWDALLFCFFKEHRGGGERSNLVRLIHDRADRAEISVEFELDDQIWEIYSEISKTKRGTASVTRRVCLLTNGNKTTKCESDDAVKLWVQKNLGMSAKTFQSAVLLRQGKADAFLKAEAPDRKKILLELLQLDFYRKLGEVTAKRKNKFQESVEEAEIALNLIAADAPDEQAMENQRKQIEAIETAIENLTDDQKRKTVELGNARLSEKFRGEIARIEKLQTADKQLFERATEIREKHNRLCELENDLLRLENLWGAKEEFERETTNLRDVLTKLDELEIDLKKLSDGAAIAAREAETARSEFDRAEENLQGAIAANNEFGEMLRQIGEIEKLETAVAEKQKELDSFQAILSNRDRIRENLRRYEHLREGLELLLELERAEGDLRSAEDEARELTSDLQEKESSHREVLRVVKDAGTRLKTTETEQSNLRNELSERRGDLKIRREKLVARNSLTGAIECPTCGTELDERQAERLADELQRVANEIVGLETRESELTNALRRNEIQLAEFEREKITRENESQRIGNETTAIKTNLEHAASRVENCRRQFNEAKRYTEDAEAGNRAETETEFALLENAPRESERLDKATAIEGNVNAVVESLREQSNRFPVFSSDERAEIRRAAAICQESLSSREDDRRAAELALKRREKTLSDLLNQTTNIEIALEAKRELRDDLRTREREAHKKVETAREAVSSTLAEVQAACDNKSQFENLQIEKNDLQKFTAESKSLDEAEKRQNILEGEVSGWRKQLDEIPLEHRRDVPAVEEESEQIDISLSAAKENLRIADNDLCEMRNRRAACAIKQSEYRAAAKTFGLWSKLADAFGKKGLEARIVQTAQESVKQNANSVLESLSGGAFQIELEESANGDELQILVRDANTQNAADKARAFEFFSGGESLLIAVSLAIAIGQAVAGRTAANTLIIDEGFGALDNNRRELLVEELGRLSRDVLQGGRVIVVSHQDDVKEKFGNRFLLHKTDDGLTNVELYGKV